MKIIVGLFTILISLSVFADSGETRSFLYDGSQSTVEMLLRGEKTHTEYRYERRQTTCSRREVMGHRTVCTGGGRSGPGRPAPRTCRTVPVYRTVYYPCTQTVTIPYEVKDYDVEARVVVDVNKLSDNLQSVEEIKVRLMGDSLSIDVHGSKKFIAVLRSREVQNSMSGAVKYLDASFGVDLVPAAPVLNSLEVSHIYFEDNKITFKLGKETRGRFLGFSLNIMKRPILGSNTVLFDRELSSVEYSIDGDLVTIDLSNTGVELRGGRYGITPRVFFNHAGKVLNRDQFNSLEASGTLILKN
jgi:hypothetical protein